MAGHHNPRRPFGPPHGGPPPQPPNQLVNPNFGFQDPIVFQYLQSFPSNAPYTYNFPVHNPNFVIPQNPSLPPQQDVTSLAYNHSPVQVGARRGSQQSSSLPPQQVFHGPGNQFHAQGEGSKFQHQNSSVHPQQVLYEPVNQFTVLGEGVSGEKDHELVKRAEEAVVRAQSDIASAGESVSSWKVWQKVLRALQFGSWSDLGLRMQDVPSLRKLMDTEAKINVFIRCFVVVQKIATLHELEIAICKNEGVKTFEDLHMGPLLSHPLVLQYFLPSGDTSGVCKLKSETLIAYLSALIDDTRNENISGEEFLDFVAKKLSVTSREKLGVRIQGLGLYIKSLKDSKRLDNSTKKKWSRALELKERYIAVTERVETFNSVNKEFCGKHIRFESSSEDEDVDESSGSEETDINERDEDEKNNVAKLPVKTVHSSERLSRCPYPSATEELTRLGLSIENDSRTSPASGSSRNIKKSKKRSRKIDSQSCNSDSAPKKKRRNDSLGFSISSSGNFLVREGAKQEVLPIETESEGKKVSDLDEVDFSISSTCMRVFITTWKEACKERPLTEVLKRMLQFYALPGRKFKRVQLMKAYPIIGLLNVAVMSIKNGMWDSMYDAIKDSAQHDHNDQSDSDTAYEIIDVDPVEKDTDVKSERSLQHVKSVTAEEIVNKLVAYLENNHEIQTGKTIQEQKFIFLKRLSECESWLSEQFSVREFKSLGFGEFFMFLGRHFSLLPIELQNFLASGVSERSPFEVCVLQQVLTVFVAQASHNIWQNESINKEMIQLLFMRQFPLLCFTVSEHGRLEDFLETVKKHKNDIVSKHVLFSASLFGTSKVGHSLASLARPYSSEESGIAKLVTSKDAINVLLRAPMMADLCLWAHWDFVFAPSLGPIVKWLLNEVSTRELLCLVTRDGKVIRIDHSATLDKFLEAALKGSSFETAVELLSLFSLSGGFGHVPLSLLKCYAEQAVKVNVKNHLEDMATSEMDLKGQHIHTDDVKREMNPGIINKAVPLIPRFILDCLSLLPTEFRGFGADILLYGLRSTTKSAPSLILSECKNLEERLMLHDLGLTLGILEWMQDHHTFSATNSADLNLSKLSDIKTVLFKLHLGSNVQSATLNSSSTEGEITIRGGTDRKNGKNTAVCAVDTAEGSTSRMSSSSQEKADINQLTDAALVIESIRRVEFGLDSNISDVESCMLKKQHARLGRALQCLSQELYSQDSHFLLELIQNADDNIYPENVEPTLTFILQESGITVLNNEQGFSAQNIRALCDVGSSTKSGGVGYIGKKGIGFKSVFRVTDAPEIHSNGFHVKFDITDGQIGFVLPTGVPPCNIEYFRELLRSGTNELDDKCWKTCIILPFASRIDMSNILAMFSDLHPSSLLFLHRLDCIVLRNMVNNSLAVMTKELIGNGLVNVSVGKEKMTWFVASQKLQADGIRRDLQMTEIAIALTLHESSDGYYDPVLDQQPVFAFLPLRAYGLKFILQGDFILPSSREEVDGDSAWNQWLLSEFPGLFVSAEKSFCSLPCFRETPGKAVSAFMSFVPLVGEVHGFFSPLPRMIISKLRTSNCLLLEGDKKEWVPPCKVLRGWSEEARILFSNDLLHEHLGLGFLDRDIFFSDSLARALGVEEYGPNIMVRILSSICLKNGLSSLGVGWLSTWLNAFYLLSYRSSHQGLLHSGIDTYLIDELKKIPFILLSNGTFTSVKEGPIWVQLDMMNGGFDSGFGLEAFPKLSGKLRIVSPALFSVSDVNISCMNMSVVGNITSVLHSIGVQQLSAHDILKLHILPVLSIDNTEDRDKALMIDYLCFVMIHLQSNCTSCRADRGYIIAELQNKALILTNNGLKRLAEVSVHFGKEFGNMIDIKRMIGNANMKWREVDITYLQHPATKSLSSVLNKWREFLEEIGVTDFVQVVHVDKNLASMSTLVEQLMLDLDLVSQGSLVRDWESRELVMLLSLLSESSNREGCMYLLEVVDRLWDDYFSEKTNICFNNSKSIGGRHVKSSFLCKLCEVQWVASSMDNKLHCPKDLFHDCNTVRSILGVSAPFAVPKVASRKLIEDLGFKCLVTLSDVLEILKSWRSKTSFKASIAQMSRLYSFIWNEILTAKQTNTVDFCSTPFIFVPYNSGSGPEDVVEGAFLSAKEVYWHDSTGTTKCMQASDNLAAASATPHPLDRSLCNVYPGLHAFFVRDCGVAEQPSLHDYLKMLLQLSAVALPSQAAGSVFQVLLKWAEGMKSGALGSEDITHMRESLAKQEFTVLPTVVDKWVSLHPSFGFICWCDDKKLGKEFKIFDAIDFLYFGNLDENNEELLNTKVSAFLRALGTPILSDVVSRESICDGVVSNGFKASLMNWTLPLAQRYLYSVHPEKYLRLKHSGFSYICDIQVIVVEKLYYKNVIKNCGIESKKRIECNCLLQDNILYTTSGADSHALFLEFSRLLFDGTPDLHLANFLHMITTMVESGSTEEQTEFFILNSQKMPKLPADESVWQISFVQSSAEGSEMPQSSSPLASTDEKGTLRSTKKLEISSWPPIDWKTAPGFSDARANGFTKTPASIPGLSGGSGQETSDANGRKHLQASGGFTNTVNAKSDVGDDYVEDSTALIFFDPENAVMEYDKDNNQTDSSVKMTIDSVDLSLVCNPDEVGSSEASRRGEHNPSSVSSGFNIRDQLSSGNPSPEQALLTGKLGELAAFKYYTETLGRKKVRWVNKDSETGLPYDLVIGGDGERQEFVEVKATRSARKDWFHISTREWQLAAEMGNRFIIVHVVLSTDREARLTVYRNPVKQCQQRKLQLVVLMPEQRNDFSVKS